ncbi:phosphatase PAP2 family protein [Fluoribacter gormanii]|uniref:phosphatase PAP2 family protein n=1 Tax=Fluoribacter gormanii TaxID=464 RepID=UPI00224345A7|nr:phosphatase PAP2 family protein [Fluoribacter gormanii]MCW8443819.1 phosphatase PAP2 family protein [Fluoribacter gormanii]
MYQVSSRSIVILSSLVLILSSIVFSINHFFYKYPGNNYFPEGIPFLALVLILLNLGLVLYFPKDNKIRQVGRELIYFFSLMCIIAIATNAVQLTPFPIIDPLINTLEECMDIRMEAILAWTHNHQKFKYLLGVIYDSLTYQMSILPLLIIITCRFHLIREYYFYMLSTVLIGFTFYYFFPTTAPASIINSPFFSPEQIDTGLKFRQIHHYINPTTNEGGLIAFPSFHAIWAILCVNLLREWPIACILLFIINLFLIASCVLLGWHYLVDIIGGFIVLLLSYCLLKYCSICAAKRCPGIE